MINKLTFYIPLYIPRVRVTFFTAADAWAWLAIQADRTVLMDQSTDL
jgi:hypothetical protein